MKPKGIFLRCLGRRRASQRGVDRLAQVGRGKAAGALRVRRRRAQRRRDLHHVTGEDAHVCAEAADEREHEVGREPLGLGGAGRRGPAVVRAVDVVGEVDAVEPEAAEVRDDRARVYRGGSFNSYARFLRCANRQSESPGARWGNVGFRCVVDVGVVKP